MQSHIVESLMVTTQFFSLRSTILLGLLCALVASPLPAWSEDVYQEPADFIAETFAHEQPKVAMLYFSGKRRAKVAEILGHSPAGLRTRYWHAGEKTAWILEEIGKVKPITIGVVIEQAKIQDVRILIYRESHGAEVSEPYFTRQFKDASLQSDSRLSQRVDGIAGATLSVNAVRRIARVALFLDSEHRTAQQARTGTNAH